MEHLIVYLEKVWNEYTEYRDFLKDISKSPEELRKEAYEKISKVTSKDEAVEIVCNVMEKQNLHQADFLQQLQRLFYTVGAFDGVIEIPEEIKKEVSNLEFIQIFAIKDKKERVINEKALEFNKNQIKNLMSNGVEDFKKRYF
jgi:hypothetical protein